MKKTALLFRLALIGTVSLVLACGGSKYGDAEKVLSEEITIMSTFAEQMEKAGDADAVAAAINTFTKKMEKLVPRLKELTEKYPEMKAGKDLPASLEKQMAEAESMGRKLQGAMMKTMQYMMNAKVRKAWEEYGRIMSAMGS